MRHEDRSGWWRGLRIHVNVTVIQLVLQGYHHHLLLHPHLHPHVPFHHYTVEPKEDQGMLGNFLAGMQPKPEWREDDLLNVEGLAVTELPDSFDDALQIAVDAAKECFDTGRMRVRLEFDTTAGDLTYTTLKNSMPLVCKLLIIHSTALPSS